MAVTSLEENGRDQVAHDVRHDFDYDMDKESRRVKLSRKLRDKLNAYTLHVIDPRSYPLALPPVARNGKTFGVTVRMQIVASPILCNGATSGDQKYRTVISVGEGFDSAGASCCGTLLPLPYSPGTNIFNVNVLGGTGSTDANVNNLLIGANPAKCPFETEMQTVKTTLIEHASSMRVVSASVKATPVGPALTRQGIFYGASFGRGGSIEVGSSADLSIQKLYDAESFVAGSGVDEAIFITYFPPDNEAFNFIPTQEILVQSEIPKQRDGSLIVALEDCSASDDVLFEITLSYECIPANASFELVPTKQTLVDTNEMDFAWNCFQTQKRCHALVAGQIDMDSFQSRSPQAGIASKSTVRDITKMVRMTKSIKEKEEKDLSINNNVTPKPSSLVVYVKPKEHNFIAVALDSEAGSDDESGGFWGKVGKGINTALKYSQPVIDVLKILAPLFI